MLCLSMWKAELEPVLLNRAQGCISGYSALPLTPPRTPLLHHYIYPTASPRRPEANRQIGGLACCRLLLLLAAEATSAANCTPESISHILSYRQRLRNAIHLCRRQHVRHPTVVGAFIKSIVDHGNVAVTSTLRHTCLCQPRILKTTETHKNSYYDYSIIILIYICGC